MKNWKVLKNEGEYKCALNRTIELFSSEPGTPEFELLLVLVKDYEDKHIILPQLNPVEVIKLKMEEKGLKAKDLEGVIGSKRTYILSTFRKKGINFKDGKSFKNLPWNTLRRFF